MNQSQPPLYLLLITLLCDALSEDKIHNVHTVVQPVGLCRLLFMVAVTEQRPSDMQNSTCLTLEWLKHGLCQVTTMLVLPFFRILAFEIHQI